MNLMDTHRRVFRIFSGRVRFNKISLDLLFKRVFKVIFRTPHSKHYLLQFRAEAESLRGGGDL